MASLNKVTLIGRLGRDPEIRSGVANMSVATSESWKDKASGEWKERTEWHRVVIFNEHLVKVAERLSKGVQVYIEGALQTRKWTDKDGIERYSTEIVLGKFGGALMALEKVEQQAGASGGFGSTARDDLDDLDSEIPF